MTIGQLGYLGFQVSHVDAWEFFLGQGLGLMPGEATRQGPRFRVDDLAWRIALESGPQDDLACGFEVADAEVLDAVGRRLGDAGVPVGKRRRARWPRRSTSRVHLPECLLPNIYNGCV